MAMRELLEGDCGLTNPLLKVAGLYTQDKAPQAIQRPRGSASDQLVKEFLLESNQVERCAPDTFSMQSLLHQMSEIDELHNQPSQRVNHSHEVIPGEHIWLQNYLESQDLAYENNRVNTLDSLDNNWAQDYLITSEQDIQNQRSLGNEWAQNFKAGSCSEVSEIATALSESVTDPKISESKFMKFIQKVGDGDIDLEKIENSKQVTPTPVADIWSADFAAAWSHPVNTALDEGWDGVVPDVPPAQVLRTEDEKEEEQQSDDDFWDNLQREWEKMAKDEPAEHSSFPDYDNFDLYKDYSFNQENPFREHSNPFEEGLQMLQTGDLPSAVLLFEAAVQQDPQHIEAWQYLATSQAKNEHDRAAISAAKRCLELDPGNLTALMSLAVSYTNESMSVQACETLVQWLHHNPKYRHLVPPAMLQDNSTVSSISREKHTAATQDMYIEAARMSPKDPDADVQNGLGVLFNLSGDYEKAIDCFKSALSVKPEDSLLWNRLGATLANSNRSGEAFDAYYRALELYPGLIRSRFNLGVSCINLNAIKEAVEHFLLALNLQNAGRGPQGVRSQTAMSSNIWSTLRTAITFLQRSDLYEAVDRKDLDLLNREFGMEV